MVQAPFVLTFLTPKEGLTPGTSIIDGPEPGQTSDIEIPEYEQNMMNANSNSMIHIYNLAYNQDRDGRCS